MASWLRKTLTVTVTYYDDGSACDGATCHPSTVHLHCQTDQQVYMAWAWMRECQRRSVPRDPPETLVGYPWSQRYFCIIGPGGRVLNVTP